MPLTNRLENIVAAPSQIPNDAPVTLGSFGERKLRLCCEGLGLSHESAAAVEVFRRLSQTWSSWPLGDAPAWSTDITDDRTPFEFSVAFDGGLPKLRMLVEAQQAPLTLSSSWEAGLRVNEALRDQPGVDLARFERVRDLFAPARDVQARFAMWHAAVMESGGRAAYKLYLNPQILGPHAATGMIQESMERLGMDSASEFLLSRVHARGGKDSFLYFSLDLSAKKDARVKVYVAHERATADEIEAQLDGCRDYVHGTATGWINKLLGGSGPFTLRPILSCFAFNATGGAPTVTLHLPARCYTEHDGRTVERACNYLTHEDGRALQRALSLVGGRPLEMGRSLVTYVSLRPTVDRLNVTTYVAPEAYAIAAPRLSLRPPDHSSVPKESMIRELRPQPLNASPALGMADVQEMIARHQARLAEHPFLKRLESPGTLEDVRIMAPRLTFFVMCFQDMLRLVREHVSHPELKPIARTHELEDKGHDNWFLGDLEKFDITPDIRWMFGPAHEVARDISYGLISEVLSAEDDWSRLAVVLSLEAAGAEFFGRVIAFIERTGHGDGLRYFARSHQEIEANHDVFESDKRARLLEMPLTERVAERATRTVDRTFSEMTKLATYLDHSMAETSRKQLQAERMMVSSRRKRRA
jgi:tryptophan dimethylallyltransferase